MTPCVVQIWSSGKPPGVVRSPLQPEETRGLTRSDDLSRMLPFEAHLMAAGWPKNDTDADGNEVVREGSRPARLLHMVRRAERNLMSYERTGMPPLPVEKKRKEKKRKEKKPCSHRTAPTRRRCRRQKKKRKEQKRSAYAFWRQFDEKPSTIPGCRDHCLYVLKPCCCCQHSSTQHDCLV